MTVKEAIRVIEDFDYNYEADPTELSDIEDLLTAAQRLVEEIKNQNKVISDFSWLVSPDRMGS